MYRIRGKCISLNCIRTRVLLTEALALLLEPRRDRFAVALCLRTFHPVPCLDFVYKHEYHPRIYRQHNALRSLPGYTCPQTASHREST